MGNSKTKPKVPQKQKKQPLINAIGIPLSAHCITDCRFNAELIFNASYVKEYTIQMAIDGIIDFIKARYHPIHFVFDHTEMSSFMGCINTKSPILSNPITNYTSANIIRKGIILQFKIMYHHKINERTISCQHMNKLNTKDPMRCPIYQTMMELDITQHCEEDDGKQEHKSSEEPDTTQQQNLSSPPIPTLQPSNTRDSLDINRTCRSRVCQRSIISGAMTENELNDSDPGGYHDDYEGDTENLKHLQSFSHFTNEYEYKPKCKGFDKCPAFIRNQNMPIIGYLDKCHLALYTHPPASRNLKLPQNVHSLVVNKKASENHPLYEPTNEDKEKYGYNENDGYLSALIEEVINNGFKSDLCLNCRHDDECKHDIKDSEHSILKIADEKKKHQRHQSMGNPLNVAQILSLILYTGLCSFRYVCYPQFL